MNGLDRMMIMEIEDFSLEMGLGHLTVMGKLADLEDGCLVRLRDALAGIAEVGNRGEC